MDNLGDPRSIHLNFYRPAARHQALNGLNYCINIKGFLAIVTDEYQLFYSQINLVQCIKEEQILSLILIRLRNKQDVDLSLYMLKNLKPLSTLSRALLLRKSRYIYSFIQPLTKSNHKPTSFKQFAHYEYPHSMIEPQ